MRNRIPFEQTTLGTIVYALGTLLLGVGSVGLVFHEKEPLERIKFLGMVFFAFGGVGLYFLDLFSRRISQATRKRVETFCAFAAMGGLIIYWGTWIANPPAWRWIQAQYLWLYSALGIFFTVFGTIVLTAVGYILFLLKTKKLIVYAYGEILFALTSCYVAMLRSREGLSVGTATVLMASVYIVVRGLENRHKAISTGTASK
jgi:hypothetical protein